MIEKRELTCIVCPLGCQITVAIENGEIADIKGYSCKRGELYAKAECTNPLRVLTSTVRVINGQLPLVPVKTDKPVPKAMVMDCMREINRIRIHTPVKAGDILLKNILNTGSDIIATGTVQ